MVIVLNLDTGEDIMVSLMNQNATIGSWKIYWTTEENVERVACGMSYTRLQLDFRVQPDIMKRTIARLRGSGWEPPIGFFKQAHNFHW